GRGGQRGVGVGARGVSFGLRRREALPRFLQRGEPRGVAADLALDDGLGLAGRIRRMLRGAPVLAGFAFGAGGGGERRLGRFEAAPLAFDIAPCRAEFALERLQPAALGETPPPARRALPPP